LRKRLVGVVLGTAGLLLLPLLAGRFTAEVNWGLGDYAVAAALLLAAGFGVVFALHRVSRGPLRAVAVSAIVVTVALVWAELAVGLFR